jgi:hypothetical protein
MRARSLLLLGLLGAACGPAAVRPLPPAATSCSPCPTTLVFHNETSAVFRLVRITALLDGEPLFLRADTERLADERRLALAEDLPLSGGDHTLNLLLVFRGAGQGVFSYLSGYTFTVRSTHRFAGGSTRVLTVRVHERPVTVPLAERLAVRFEAVARGASR